MGRIAAILKDTVNVINVYPITVDSEYVIKLSNGSKRNKNKNKKTLIIIAIIKLSITPLLHGYALVKTLITQTKVEQLFVLT